MDKVKSKKIKIGLFASITVLLGLIVAMASVGIYFANRKPSPVQEDVSSSWNTDVWSGGSSVANFKSGAEFANRGDKVFTINSADSFAYFVSLTNNAVLAKEYGYFAGYTIYLNKNIDFAPFHPLALSWRMGNPLSKAHLMAHSTQSLTLTSQAACSTMLPMQQLRT